MNEAEAKRHEAEAKAEATHHEAKAKAEATSHEAKAVSFGVEAEARPRGLISLTYSASKGATFGIFKVSK